MSSSPHPEGPGSVSGAPNLPAGFTDTFTSRYVDTGEVRLHAVVGGDGPPLLLVHGWPETLVRVAPGDAGAGPGLRGHRRRPARHRPVRQARGRLRHRHARRRPGRADGRARPRALRRRRPRHRLRDQLRAGRRPPGPRRARGAGRDPRPARARRPRRRVFVPAPINDRLWHLPFNRRRERSPSSSSRAGRTSSSARSSRSRAADAARRGDRLLRRPAVRPGRAARQLRLVPGARRDARAGRGAQDQPADRCPCWRSAARRATATTSPRRCGSSPTTSRAWSSPAPATGSPRRRRTSCSRR